MTALWLTLGAIAIVVVSLLAGVCAGFIKEYKPAPTQQIHYCTPSSTDELCLRARARMQALDAVAGEPSAAPAH